MAVTGAGALVAALGAPAAAHPGADGTLADAARGVCAADAGACETTASRACTDQALPSLVAPELEASLDRPEASVGTGGAREIVVEVGALRDEARVASYDQPEWTVRRRVARSRFDVRPEGTTDHAGIQAEARWAPANWGELWGNPTLYGEFELDHDAEDAAEAKVLFGDELQGGWHWAVNLSLEQQLGGEREREAAITGALSWAVLDQQLSIGIEGEYQKATAKGSRGDANYNAYLGPSIQWRPVESMHIDIVPLFGLQHDDVDMTLYLVFGIDLGGGDETRSVNAPISTRSR